MESHDELERRRVYLAQTRRATLFAGMAVVAALISALNFAAVISSFWQPMGAFNLPVYLLFAVTALFAAVSFLKTRRRVLSARDHSDESEVRFPKVGVAPGETTGFKPVEAHFQPTRTGPTPSLPAGARPGAPCDSGRGERGPRGEGSAVA